MNIDGIMLWIETIIFLIYSHVFLESRFSKSFFKVILSILGLVVLQLLCNLEVTSRKLYVSLILDGILLAVLFADKIGKILFVLATYYSITIASQACIILLFSYKFHLPMLSFITNPLHNLVVFSINCCVIIGIIFLIYNIKHKKWLLISTKGLLLLSSVTVCSMITLWHIFPFYNCEIPVMDPALYSLCFIIIIFHLVVYLSYTLYQKLSFQNILIQSNQHKLEYQKRHYQSRIDMEDSNKQIVHDYMKTLQTLRALLPNDSRRASQYLDALIEKAYKPSRVLYTGNVMADAIIHSFDTDTITIHCTNVLPPTLFVSDVDITLLLGNALENATCYLKNNPELPQEVTVDILCEGMKLFIQVSNPVDFSIEPQVYKNPTEVGSSGEGLKIMVSVAEKYEGSLKLETKDGKLFVKIILLNVVDS